MTKSIVPLMVISALIVSCNKTDTVSETSETQKEVVLDSVIPADTLRANNIVEEDIEGAADAYTYNYKADDGTMAVATFLNTDQAHTLTIKMDEKTYVLDQTQAWAKGADYEKDGVKAHNQRDDLDVTIEGKNIKLKRQYDTK